MPVVTPKKQAAGSRHPDSGARRSVHYRDNKGQTWDALVLEDVAGTNEVQRVTMGGTVTGGTFTLTFDGQTTGAIQWNATAAAVVTALEALSNVGAGDVAGSGGPFPGAAVDITFQGDLSETDVAQMTAASSLTGTGPTVTTSTVTAGSGAGAGGAKLQLTSHPQRLILNNVQRATGEKQTNVYYRRWSH